MAFDYSSLQSPIAQILDTFGGDITVDLDDGATTGDTKGLFTELSYSQKQDNRIDDDAVRILLPADAPVTPTQRAVIVSDSKEYVIQSVNPLSPDGQTPLYYEVTAKCT